MAVFGGDLKQGRLKRDFQEGGNCWASPPGIQLIVIIIDIDLIMIVIITTTMMLMMMKTMMMT